MIRATKESFVPAHNVYIPLQMNVKSVYFVQPNGII